MWTRSRTEQPRHHVSAPPPDTYFMRIRTIDKDGVAGPFGRTQSIEVKGREDHGWFVLLPLSLWLLLVL